MRFSIPILIIASCFTLGCPIDSSGQSKASIIEEMLTKSNEISGWKLSSEFWIARSINDLANYIDGESVLYTDFGFSAAVKQGYEGKVLGNSVTVEFRIFDQGNSINAKSVFDEAAGLMSNPIDWKAGQGAKIERFSLSQRIILWNSKYYITLSITSGSDEALDVLRLFAANVNNNIKK